jgi:hypothetical protein
MVLDDMVLAEAEVARDRMEGAQDELERARGDYHRAIRRLHAAGGSLREIAEALGLSHQRVHQVVESGSMIDPSPAQHRSGPTTQAVVRCSFCNLNQKAVKKLIAGPGFYICDRCVRVVLRLGHSDSRLKATRVGDKQSVAVVEAEQPKTTCSFCGKRRSKVAWMVVGSAAGAHICNECTELCRDILAEELKE